MQEEYVGQLPHGLLPVVSAIPVVSGIPVEDAVVMFNLTAGH